MIHILIVEDDQGVLDNYVRSIKSYNLGKANNLQFSYELLKNKDSAIDALNMPLSSYDGAIVDLDLKNSNGNDSSGNEVIKTIKDNLRFPIFVISGTTYNIDKNLEESTLFKIRTRDDQEFDYLSEFSKIYKTGITKILGRKGVIDEYLRKIFWIHLSNTMDLWIEDTTQTEGKKEKAISRYIAMHIGEYLELNEDSSFEDFSSAEVYIIPPIKDHIFTGDIVQEIRSNNRFIILTPACDLSHEGKTDMVLLVRIKEIEECEMGEIVTSLNMNGIGKDKKNNLTSKLKNYISNKKNTYNHFLPKYKDLKPGLIDFQIVKSVSKSDTENKQMYKRLAALNPNFTKDIAARFAIYYSRQGSPDFNSDNIIENLLN